MTEEEKEKLIPPMKGLSDAQVEERVAKGLNNKASDCTGKTIKQIILSNVFTYFNLIFLILVILLCIARSFRNLTFLPVIIGNTLIGIFQEIRAKKTLEKMSILNAPHAIVIRNGVEKQILSEELVKDDIIRLSAGDQICADAVVVQGAIQVNESLLTGESDEIDKKSGGSLMSGSFVTAGQCYARLVNVGDEAYVAKLNAQAKAMGEGEQSEMIQSINRIVMAIGITVIPIGAALFAQGYFINGEGVQKSIVSMVAAIIGMIPEGLYLLTTVALALSTIKLASKKVLLHDMKSIEALARVDVLCVDKTGTITEPKMQVERIVAAVSNFICDGRYSEVADAGSAVQSAVAAGSDIKNAQLVSLLAEYTAACDDSNATMEALREYLAKGIGMAKKDKGKITGKQRKVLDVLPFSSSRKYSSVTFEDGTYYLGAPEFVMQDGFDSVEAEISAFTDQGYRVLLLAREANQSEKNGNPVQGAKQLTARELSEGMPEIVCAEKQKMNTGNRIALGYVILSNPIRENAVKTFSYFKEQGVSVKVISGDNPRTVSRVALQAGIENAEEYVDAATLTTEEALKTAANKYTVFGRVTPQQKRELVAAMQGAGHTVAMTGDGVNDILAMKDADCSVAMASGSEAAAQAAQVVLLDSDFAKMPDVVLEGRRVVNNIERSASLFLVKNIFSVLLAVFSLVFTITYPLEPAQISLISMFTIGTPGFLLALEPNKERIKGHFMKNVLLRALPAGLTDVLTVGALVICGQVFHLADGDVATAATMILAVVGFMILIKLSHPFNAFKSVVLGINIAGLLLCSLFLSDLFAIRGMSAICVLLTVMFGFAAESLFRYLTLAVDWIDRQVMKLVHRRTEKRRKRKKDRTKS